MYVMNGQRLLPDTQFLDGAGNQYPSNWLRLASAEDMAAIGIVEVAEPVRPDERYYLVARDADGSYTATARPLVATQAERVAAIEGEARALLAASDWEVIRAAEGIAPVSATTRAYRAALRAEADRLVRAIQAAQSIADLLQLGPPNWPEKPPK